MQTTPNIGLKKPEGNNVVDIEDLNYNADEIDKQIKDLSEQIGSIDLSWDKITGKYRDARGEGKKLPSWYVGKGQVIELSDFNEIIGGGSGMCTVVTYSAWHDTTGGMYQIIFSEDGRIYHRKRTNESTWSNVIATNNGGDADTLDGKHASDFANVSHTHQHQNVLEIGGHIDFHSLGSSSDYDARLSLESGGLVWRTLSGNHTMNITQEIIDLKQSVVNGKQQVVNALNDKYGYNTGLTTKHTHQDYAWWIRAMPVAPSSTRMNNDTRVSVSIPAVKKNFSVVNSQPYTMNDVYYSMTVQSDSRFRFGAPNGSLRICYSSTIKDVAKGTEVEVETGWNIQIYNPTGLPYTITPVYWSGPVEGWSLIS